MLAKSSVFTHKADMDLHPLGVEFLAFLQMTGSLVG